jgi:tellurite resistance protein TerB
MLDWLKDNIDSAKKAVQAEVSRYKNREFMEAVIAACTKIAYSDGIVDPKEKQKMMQFFQHCEELQVFKTDEVIEAYTKISAKFDFDLDIGNMEAMKTISKLRSKPDAARTLVRLSLIIANADGKFDASEQAAARDICKELNLDPADFNL